MTARASADAADARVARRRHPASSGVLQVHALHVVTWLQLERRRRRRRLVPGSFDAAHNLVLSLCGRATQTRDFSVVRMETRYM